MRQFKGWQRNRILLAILIGIAVVVMNIPGLTAGQILSLIALIALGFYLYVRYLNKY